MRFALEVGPGSWLRNGVDATVELVLRAERAGFSTVWASEDPDGWDAFAALAVLARSTERIAFGTGVTNPYLRHPNLIAASVATLDRASDGRAFLGLGRGEPAWYGTAFALEIGSPLKRVEATVSLLRQWWSDGQVATGNGEVPVRAWRRAFPPLGKPPIYIAATGPKMQAAAGRIADGMRLNTLASLLFIREAVARTRAARPADAEGEFRVFAHPSVVITESDEEREQELERLKGTIALIHVLPGMDRQLAGLEERFPIDQILADLRAAMKTDEVLARGGSFADLRRAGDFAAARRIVPTDLVREVAIVGRATEVRARLRDYGAAGVTDVFIESSRMTEPGDLELLSAP